MSYPLEIRVKFDPDRSGGGLRYDELPGFYEDLARLADLPRRSPGINLRHIIARVDEDGAVEAYHVLDYARHPGFGGEAIHSYGIMTYMRAELRAGPATRHRGGDGAQ